MCIENEWHQLLKAILMKMCSSNERKKWLLLMTDNNNVCVCVCVKTRQY